LAKTLRVREECLSDWIGAGLIEPVATDDGAPVEFDIPDATALRSLCDNDRPGMRAATLRTTLDRLRAWLPSSPEPMQSVTLVAGAGMLLMRLPDGSLADAGAQFHFPFESVAGPLGRIGRADPTTAIEWHEHGIAQEIAGDPDAAIASYARALLVGGPDAQITFDLAYALAASGDLDRAIERYRQVVELDPLRADAWVNLGDLLLSDDQTEPAIHAFRHALALDPDDAAAHYNLADALDAAGDPRRAALHFSAFLRLADDPPQHVAYARHRVAQSRRTI
jgi:tetratricopeptide (TPR) repeat protein